MAFKMNKPKIKIKHHNKGYNALRQGGEVTGDLARRAAAVQQQTGDGYGYKVGHTGTRARATVFTGTPDAMRDNASNNTLVRAIRAAR